MSSVASSGASSLAFALAVSLSLGTGCAHVPPPTEAARFAGRDCLEAVDAGAVERAGALCAAALDEDARVFDARLGAGRLALLRGRLDEAAPHLEAALRLDGADPAALNAAGVLALLTDDRRRAEDLLRRAARSNEGAPDALYNLARAYRAWDEPGRAQATLNELLQAQPGRYDALFLAALLVFEAGQADDAVERFLNAVRADPWSPIGWRGLGSALYLGRRYREAARAFGTCERLSEGTTPCTTDRARVAARQPLRAPRPLPFVP